MAATSLSSALKVVGAKGQISLGEQHAGRQVLVEEQEPGVWLIRAVTVLPDNERWLHEPRAAADLEKALSWATANPAEDAETERLLEKIADSQG